MGEEVGYTIQGEQYEFDSLDQLYETAKSLPDVERHDVYARNEDINAWESVPWRDSLWTEDGRMAGEVSASDDWYNIIQYGDILETVGDRLDDHGVDPNGTVTVSPSAHKMTAKIGLDETLEPRPGDEIKLQLHARSGHSGYHGVKYDVGAERLICSNGMTGFIADQTYEQTHSEEFRPQLAYHAVDSIIQGTDVVEQRLQQAQERSLTNQDEALLVLHDLGIDQYLEDPTTDLLNALREEVEDPEDPSLYETFNAATYALTHLSGDVPEYELQEGYEQASQLLEYGEGIPHPSILGENAVRSRAQSLIESDDPEEQEYWEGESETVRELMRKHEVKA